MDENKKKISGVTNWHLLFLFVIIHCTGKFLPVFFVGSKNLLHD